MYRCLLIIFPLLIPTLEFREIQYPVCESSELVSLYPVLLLCYIRIIIKLEFVLKTKWCSFILWYVCYVLWYVAIYIHVIFLFFKFYLREKEDFCNLFLRVFLFILIYQIYFLFVLFYPDSGLDKIPECN